MLTLRTMILILLFSTTLLTAVPLVQLQNIPLHNDGHLLQNKAMLQNFYANRQNHPIWLSDRGIKGKKAMQLLKYIHADVTLNSKGYIYKKSQKIKQSLERRHTQRELLQLEIQLTSLYYEVLQHTIYGEIDWQDFQAHLQTLKESKIDGKWVRYPLKFDILQLMSQENILQTIQQVTPKQYGYKKLLRSLSKLYGVKWKGGWGRLPASNTLKLGSTGAIVKQLRQRLTLSGDYQGCQSRTLNTKFDKCLHLAVKKFQRRHGLQADGVVGKGTKKILNISVTQKIKTVLLNIDRIKWLPRRSSQRHIVVNIPEYMLHYMEHTQEIKRHRVIVGDTKHPTPIFSDKVSYITLNPYWKLPASIVRKEVVPAMLKNPNYIKRQGLEAHSTWEENSSIVPLDDINWANFDKENQFPYRLMQPPGPRNALGKIKFKFPNKFAVYLHDTPTKHLFAKKRRAFSHGCIRLSKPVEFLKTLSRNESNINFAKAKDTLSGKHKKELYLDNKIPINLTYLTAWVTSNNELTFGDDIYNYDKHQHRRLR